VGEQLLDRDPVVDQGKVLAEDRPGRGRQLEQPALDEVHHGQGGERLATTRGPEASVDGVGDPVPAVRQPVRAGEELLTVAVDPHGAVEVRLGGHLVDPALDVVHADTLPAARPAQGDPCRARARWSDPRTLRQSSNSFQRTFACPAQRTLPNSSPNLLAIVILCASP
jgi:hypothetical protein